MKLSSLVVVAVSVCAASAFAQTKGAYRIGSVPTLSERHGIEIKDISALDDGGAPDSATRAFGYPGKRMGLQTGTVRNFETARFDRDELRNRAWGISVGFDTGPVHFRLAHQNKNVAKVAPAMPLGNRIDAKNSIFAANLDFDGSKISSSEPLTSKPLFLRAIARLCIALPPMAIKWTFISRV